MRTVKVQQSLDAAQQAVWDVLYDFPNIADWNSGVAKSFSTGTEAGVGATRHCDLKPAGGLDETLVEAEEPHRAVVRIDAVQKLPIKKGRVEFLLAAAGEGTDATLNYSYEPKGGPLAGLVGWVLDKQLASGFQGFLSDLGAEASKRASAG